MDSKPNFLLAGLFVIVGIALVFSVLIWLVRSDFDVEYKEYEILFSGSVSGLGVSGDVRFNGISIGQVKSIGIYPSDPRLVQVIVEISEDVPITVDSVAKLELQGLTGISYIDISGGTDRRLLEPQAGQEYARIASEPSTMQGLITDVPATLAEVRAAAETVTVLLNPENQKLMEQLLVNLVAISDHAAAVSDETSQNFRIASGSAVRVMSATEDVIAMAQTMSAETLPEISALVVKLNNLSSTLSALALEFDRNPTGALLGNKYPEYSPD